MRHSDSREFDHSQWDLTEEEWTRYDEVMRGPRGVWSPNLDPLTALGLEARTEDERRRYAEKLVAQEEARTRQELDFVRAYSDAWKRLWPDAKLFDAARLGINPMAPENKPFAPGDRITFFLTLDCGSCASVITETMHNVEGLLYPGLDLYFVGADAKAVQAWANANHIRRDLVEQQIVTLNLDGGLLARLQKSEKPTVPVVYRRRGEAFAPIEMTVLLKRELYPRGRQQTEFSQLIEKLKGMVQ